jgi:NAD(P)-dependent dehydrogenase (short-subunit alcohol dehydrogenase family)
MGVIQFSVRAVGAIVFILAIVAPVAVQVICQLDGAKWAVPANSVVGKTVIVTGANSGLGFETARVLAQEGAEVVMACRSAAKCKVAMEEIQQANPKANLKAQLLDLSDADSVRNFAAEFLASHKNLDLLINNAAIMATEYATVQWPGGAVESQFATNHLGPYLLTGLLQKVLESTSGSRVINHSSSASDMTARVKDVHKIAQISSGEYDAFGDQYTSSKRANRYFTWSLNQKLSGVLSVACHPGWTGTNLQHRATGVKVRYVRACYK